MSFQARLESVIGAATGEAVHIHAMQPCHGGSINQAYLLTLADGSQVFAKTHSTAHSCPAMFAMEYHALELLADAAAIRVPRAIARAEDLLVLEAFTPGNPRGDWQELMGQRLALLHRATAQQQFGFESNNYLGTTLQDNRWRDNWLSFWREQRLAPQLDLYAGVAGKDDPLIHLGAKLLDRLDTLIGHIDEPAVLLHGDLWSGNAAADENGQPIIFDPASYYGHREAELGMMRMFGGFDKRCFAAYAQTWPLQAGSEERISLYRLYHELNHLNLFGSAYYGACLATIKSLL